MRSDAVCLFRSVTSLTFVPDKGTLRDTVLLWSRPSTVWRLGWFKYGKCIWFYRRF